MTAAPLRPVHPTGVPAGVPDDYYDRIYEAERAHWWHRGMRATEATLLGDRIRPGLHILDAGCGTGGFLRWAVDTLQPGRVCGVDIGGKAIALARGRVPEAELYVRPLHRLPFASDAFELIVLNDVLQHVPDPDVRASLEELRRVARPGGALLARTGGARRTRREREDWRVYDRDDLRATLEGAGWRCERVTYANVVGSIAATLRGRVPRAPDDATHGIPAPASRLPNAIGSMALRLERLYLDPRHVHSPTGTRCSRLPPLIRRRGDGGREAAVGRDTPKHVYGFIAGSLSDLLTRHGFEVREAVVTVAGDPLFDQLYVRNTNRGGVRGRV